MNEPGRATNAVVFVERGATAITVAHVHGLPAVEAAVVGTDGQASTRSAAGELPGIDDKW